MSYGICQLPLRVFVFFSWFPWPACLPLGFPVCFDGVPPNPRIPRSEFEFIPATACVLLRVFFLYFEFISGFDALHTVLNSGLVHT